jgi:putative transcriptional regulator
MERNSREANAGNARRRGGRHNHPSGRRSIRKDRGMDGLVPAVEHKDMLHYTNSGLDNVWLVNGFERIETPHGSGVRIHDMKGLHKAIALRLVTSPAGLRGQDVRFLRSMLELSQDGLARAIGYTRPSVARWEGERGKRIPKAADHALRLFYAAYAAGDNLAHQLSHLLIELDELQHRVRREERFREADADGWFPEAA